MIILGGNVLFGLLRPQPAPQVERWLAAQDGTPAYLTAVGKTERRHSVAILPAGRRRDALA